MKHLASIRAHIIHKVVAALIGICVAAEVQGREGSPTYGQLSVEGLREEMIHIAAKIQEYESRASDIEETLFALEEQVQEKHSALEIQSDQMNAVVSSLLHLAQQSSLTTILSQDDPNNVVRAGIFLKSVVPQLQSQGMRLKQQLAELRGLQNSIQSQKKSLSEIMEEMGKKQVALTALLDRKAQAMEREPKVELDPALVKATSMPDLIKGIRSAKTKTVKGSQDLSRLTLHPPVQGKVLTTYGHHKEFSSYGKGVIIETRRKAQVVSPSSGTIVFAGPFRGYGNILILGCGPEFHLLIAGMKHINVAVGQEVLSGEPIGVMPEGEKNPKLYIELRKHTETIDPTPWIVKWSH